MMSALIFLFFILKGCIRRYSLVDGEEKTTSFFTKEQAAVPFTSYIQQILSNHFFSLCGKQYPGGWLF